MDAWIDGLRTGEQSRQPEKNLQEFPAEKLSSN